MGVLSNRAGELALHAVLERVGDLADAKRDAEVARALGMTPQGLASAKARGSIPYGRLIAFAERTNAALEYIFWGTGPRQRRSGEIDAHLFAQAAAALDAELLERKAIPTGTRDLCAAMIYNDVTALPDEERSQALPKAALRVVRILESLGGLREAGISLAVDALLSKAGRPGSQAAGRAGKARRLRARK